MRAPPTLRSLLTSRAAYLLLGITLIGVVLALTIAGAMDAVV